MAWTFGGQWAVGKAKGQPVKGGFAKSYRGPSRFAVKLPAGLDPSTAGPLMCGGVTVFSPMKVHGVGKGSKVGIIGIGGLGHMGVIIAKALGADVTAISRGESKKDDALKLGADRYIPTGKNLADDFKGHEGSLDLIVCTISESWARDCGWRCTRTQASVQIDARTAFDLEETNARPVPSSDQRLRLPPPPSRQVCNGRHRPEPLGSRHIPTYFWYVCANLETRREQQLT